MDQYNKRTRDDVHSALGMAAGGLLLYEAYTLMNPQGTGTGGGGGGGGPPYSLYIAGGFIGTYPTLAAAQAYINALPAPSVQETYQIKDSAGNLVAAGTIYPAQLVITGYFVVYGPTNQSSPVFATQGQAVAFAQTVIAQGLHYTLLEITNQGNITLSSG